MTIRKLHKLTSPGIGYCVVAGSFIPAGTGAIVTKFGTGFSVARTGVGRYRVTLDQPFADFVSLVVGAQFASANNDGHQVTPGDISIVNRTFEIQHLSSTDVSATDIAAADIATSGTANKVHFIAVIALSDVPGAGV
jgi:hypothetical protein